VPRCCEAEWFRRERSSASALGKQLAAEGGITRVRGESDLRCDFLYSDHLNLVGGGKKAAPQFEFVAGLTRDGVGIRDTPGLAALRDETLSVVAEFTGDGDDFAAGVVGRLILCRGNASQKNREREKRDPEFFH